MIAAIFPNLSKPSIDKHVRSLCQHLERHCIQYCISDSYYQETIDKNYNLGNVQWLTLAEILKSADFAISLGGDGTIISVAKELFGSHIPVCGINLGELGFLNIIEPEELDDRLNSIKKQDFLICERTVLASYLVRENGEKLELPIALNEVVIGRSKPGKMARLQLHIDRVLITEYPADGIIVATATGSTGYALSSGGPILHPALDNILVTPICPHLLQSAPLLLNAEAEVMITMPEREKALYASIDGKESFCFGNNDRLIICQKKEKIPFIYFKDQSFFKILFPKLTKSIYHVLK